MRTLCGVMLALCALALPAASGPLDLVLTVTDVSFFAASGGDEQVTPISGPAWAPFAPYNGVQGLTVTGAASATRTWPCGEGGCRDFYLTLSVSGVFSGNTATVPDPIPITWLFNAMRDGIAENTFNWDLSWLAYDNAGDPLASYAVTGGVADGNSTVTGSALLNFYGTLQAGRSLGTWALYLQMNGNYPPGTTLMMDVGPPSLDLNPYRDPGGGGEVPEPSTMLLTLGGAACLALRRRGRL